MPVHKKRSSSLDEPKSDIEQNINHTAESSIIDAAPLIESEQYPWEKKEEVPYGSEPVSSDVKPMA